MAVQKFCDKCGKRIRMPVNSSSYGVIISYDDVKLPNAHKVRVVVDSFKVEGEWCPECINALLPGAVQIKAGDDIKPREEVQQSLEDQLGEIVREIVREELSDCEPF